MSLISENSDLYDGCQFTYKIKFYKYDTTYSKLFICFATVLHIFFPKTGREVLTNTNIIDGDKIKMYSVNIALLYICHVTMNN